MTKRDISKHYGLPAAVVTVAAILYWLIGAAFVTQGEFDLRADTVDARMVSERRAHDSTRAEVRALRAEIQSQGCLIRYLSKVTGYSLQRCALEDR